jgi:hypothetical protein
MKAAHLTQTPKISHDIRDYDAKFLLGYSIAAILAALVTAMYFASQSSGTSPADLAMMVQFP